MRVVDYKTGRSPAGLRGRAPCSRCGSTPSLRWRLRGRAPGLLQLVYLGDGVLLRHVPDEAELAVTEQRVTALWSGIRDAARRGEFAPRRSALCDWCAHQALCPAFGGTPPPLDPAAVERALGVRPEAVTPGAADGQAAARC